MVYGFDEPDRALLSQLWTDYKVELIYAESGLDPPVSGPVLLAYKARATRTPASS
jgi:hypothetical protein